MEARTFQINDLYEPALTYEVRCLAQTFIIMINEYYATKYCCEDLSLIENYELAVNDHTQMWEIHHRRETIYSRKDLKEIDEYYNRPSTELIFLTKYEHLRLHRIGKHHSKETKNKLSEANIGENHPLFGKHHSEDTKKKMSKPILQYTKDGELIGEWTGASEASRVLGINQGNITSCCKGKLNSCGGFIWKYK